MIDSESAPDSSLREDTSGAAAHAWLWAGLAALLTAAVVLVALPDRSAPLALIGLAAGREIRGVDVHGGVKITYRAPAGDGDALARAARIIERRAAQLGAADVLVTDREISVEVAGVAPDAGARVARTLRGNGELTFHRVVPGSQRMRALCERAGAGADARVSCESDAWSHETVGMMHDVFLAAPDPDTLEQFLTRAAAEDPALGPEPGRMFLFEHVRPEPVYGEELAAFWRTYYAEAPFDLHRDHIADAHVYWEPTTNKPAVLVSFDDAGAARFHELTRSHVGGKLAIVLDGIVTSAPVIQDAITGGRTTISLGSGSATQLEGEAHALAAILRSRTAGEPLPVALDVVEAEPLASTVSRAQHDWAERLLALLAGLAALVLVRVVEIRAPRLDVALPGPAGARPWGRLAVTVAALAVVYAGTRFMLLPGTEELADMFLAGGADHVGQLSVFALGVMPVISAFLVVEIVALLVPRWRPLRVGGPLGRARLMRATIFLAVAFALAQSAAMALWLDSFAMRNSLPFQPGLASTATMMLTLTGGVLALWILAGLVSRHGLGNGISVILLASMAVEPGASWSMGEAEPAGDAAGGALALFVLAVCAVVAITSRVLRARTNDASGLRLPTCGIVPVSEANSLIASPAALLGTSGALAATAWIPDGIAIRLALVAVLAVAFSLLFSRPQLVTGHVSVIGTAAATRRARVFWLATAVSAAYVVGVAGLAALILRWSPGFALGAVTLAVSTAIGMDLLAEWRARRRCRDLVAVWPVHRVQISDLAVRALRDAGIGAHTRGRYHRSLLYFFGPFVPIEIMVPAGRAAEATELLSSLFGGDSLSAPPGEADADGAGTSAGATSTGP